MGRYPTKHKAHPNLPATGKEDKLKSVFFGILAIVSAPVVAVVVTIDELKWKRGQKKWSR